jgi:glycosyltransferase involved in cell wall biosynthesis
VLYKGPLVVTFHDIQPMLDPHFHSARPFYIVAAYKAFYQLAYRMAARKANYILCDSHYTRKALAQWYPPAHPKSITVPLGISKEASEPVSDDLFEEALEEYPIPPRYLLYLGSTRPNKNLANMLQGFMEYKRRHPEDSIKWVLVIRPDRFFEPLFRTLREKQLLGEVIVLEQVTEAHKRALISRAQAMTFVTMYEGFGFPVLEAQAQGVPCVAAHHGSIPEVAGTDGAYLVDPLDPQAIAAGLEAILLNPNLRQRIQEAGLKNIHRFSWETHARETLAVYDHLIETLPEARQRHPAMDPS